MAPAFSAAAAVASASSTVTYMVHVSGVPASPELCIMPATWWPSEEKLPYPPNSGGPGSNVHPRTAP